MTNKNYVTMISFVFCLMPIIESLNGFLYGKGISDVYRLLTIVLIIIYFSVYRRDVQQSIIGLLFFISIFLGLIIAQYLFFHGDQVIFIKDIKSMIRILLCPIYYLFFKETILNGDINKNDLKKIIFVYSCLFSLLIVLLYFFDAGFVSYDFEKNELTSLVTDTKGVGFKGFFIELNSLIAILCACLFFVKNEILSFLKAKGHYIFHLIIYLLICVSLVITGTKFGIFFFFICSLVFIIQILCSFLEVKIKVFFLICLSLFLVFLKLVLGNIFIGIFQRLVYFFLENEGLVLNVLFSNRLNYLCEMLKYIDISNYSIFINVFGKGFNYYFLEYKRSIVEIDFFDLYISYGIIGISSYFYFFKDSFYQLLFSKDNCIRNMIIILYVYSFLGGHIIFNSMSATFLAICLSYLTTSKI